MSATASKRHTILTLPDHNQVWHDTRSGTCFPIRIIGVSEKLEGETSTLVVMYLDSRSFPEEQVSTYPLHEFVLGGRFHPEPDDVAEAIAEVCEALGLAVFDPNSASKTDDGFANLLEAIHKCESGPDRKASKSAELGMAYGKGDPLASLRTAPKHVAPGMPYGLGGPPSATEMEWAINTLVRYSHGNAVASRWWDAYSKDNPRGMVGSGPGQRNFGELIALIHSEVSEALEGFRKGKPDDHIKNFDNFVVELADALHRIFDLAGAMGIPLATAYTAKGAYNLTRPDHKRENRSKPGGKQF